MDYTQKKAEEKAEKKGFRTVAGAFLHRYKGVGAMLFCPVITFYLFELYTHNPLETMNFKTQVLNILFYEMTGVLLLGVFRSVRAALMIQSAFFMVVGLANYYVLSFRAAPIRPWDIFSLKTAASVANNYSYRLEWETVFLLAAFLVLLAAESRFRMKVSGNIGKRTLMVLLPGALLWGYTLMIQNDRFVSEFGLYDKLFTPTVMNRRDGNIVAFLMEMEYMSVEKPSGYSADSMEQFLKNAGADSEALTQALADPESIKRPNIIVIMDEAFSDPAVLGDFITNQDYMPFVHSLQKGAENTITGTLNVSVLGGNTANTEFEFLTGGTMAFLPQGSVAYQQYLMNEIPTLASYLKELGYDTVAMHPYSPDGWDRSRVYSLMGFDTFLSKNDFAGAQKLRSYIADQACFDRMIELYEKKEEGKPLFVFNVTMQNHGGYEEAFSNFTPDITVEGVTSKSLPTYLSLIRQTDMALEKLITYFESASEDTMIVFFGDHQPTSYVTNPILRNNGKQTV